MFNQIQRHLTREFAARVRGAYGPAGEQWLQRLSQTLEEITNSWAIKLLPPFQPLSYNYVAPAVKADGTQVVLKAGVPNRELSHEIDALRHFGGQGMVRLLEADRNVGLMLLERITPGKPLFDIKDDQRATSIFATVMLRMKKEEPSGHGFPSVADWAKGFRRIRDRLGGSTGAFPKSVVDRAEGLMSDLICSMSGPVVLHGDLHHWNILSAEREPWLALDPKGVIAEPEYEVGAWLRNPFPQILQVENPKGFIARRVDQLVEELGFDRNRIIGWAYSQAVLAGVWSFEENSDDCYGWLAWADETGSLL